MKKPLFTFLLLSLTFLASAQMRYRDSNRIGISLGINQFTLNTDNFDTSAGTGWSGGLSVRGNFYNDFSMIYSIQFSENNFTVKTTNGLIEEDVKFKLPSAQISLLLSYNIIEHHLSVEVGPMFQVNGKMKIDEQDEENQVTQTMTAKDLTDVSKFSFYPTIGLTGGLKHVRLNVTYQYGVTNLLGNLNGKDFGDNFKGHAGILTGSILVYL